MSDLRVLLLTDVVDSTQLAVAVGDARMAQLWAEHDRAARDLLQPWRGREIDKTDGMLLLFGCAADAVGYALAYQRALARFDPPLAARAGLHAGPVTLRENAPADVARGAKPLEVEGVAKAVAARVMSVAQGGQVLLTDAVRQGLPEAGLQWQSHGHWRLKGLDEPIELFEVGGESACFPPPHDGDKAYRVVRQGELWLPVREIRHNLPAEHDAFVGRSGALLGLSRQLQAGVRLVSVLGIGGAGKTRTAVRLGRHWLGEFPGGVCFCDLAAARSVDGIVSAVAQGLDLPLGREDPVVQIGRAIARRGDCLLILDNFEQVARHAAQTLGHWLAQAERARFIVTTREVLGLPGEHVHVLPTLPAAEAQALLEARLQAADLWDGLDAADRAALPELVGLLDGLPLAIELAAARARVVPPALLVKRMDERFRLLTSRSGRHDRQATLRATLDWSWDLLSEAERVTLAQLSVFEGGFSLAAAEAVVRPPAAADGPWVADLLQSLLEKSLIRRSGARRFDLLRTVQDYAAERLAALGGQADASFGRHWQHFAGLGEAQATAERCAEIDNIVAACRRAGAEAGAEAGAAAVDALVNAWAALRLMGPFRAGLALAAPLAARHDLSPLHLARVSRVLGAACSLTGDAQAARAHYTRGEAIARTAGHRALAAQIRCLLADLDVQIGRLDEAQACLQAALGDPGADDTARLMAWNGLGHLAAMRSDWSQAAGHFKAALALARALGDRRREGGLEGNLGTAAMTVGDWDAARAHYGTSLAIAEELGDRQWAGNARCNLGLLLHTRGEHAAARRELAQALQAARDLGQRRLEAVALCNLGLATQALGLRAEALQHVEQAVAIAHALPSRQMEGEFRGYLGLLLGEMAQPQAARDCFDAAEALLGAGQDGHALALLHCQRALFAFSQGDVAAAAASRERARGLDAQITVAPGSELARALGQVDAALSSRN